MIATGEQYSVREFVELGGRRAGHAASAGEGKGVGRSRACDAANGRRTIVVRVDPRYFRPTEVETLLGDPTKARAQARLDAARSRFAELVREMVRADLQARRARRAGQARTASRPTTTTSERR